MAKNGCLPKATPVGGVSTPTGMPGAPTPVGGADTPGPVTMNLNPEQVDLGDLWNPGGPFGTLGTLGDLCVLPFKRKGNGDHQPIRN